jgi:hypothetical protein
MNVLLALGCLLAVLLCVAGILLRDVVHSRGLQRRGRALGFSFEAVGEAVKVPQLNATSCVQEACSSVVFNVLAGHAGGLQVRVFDLRDESLESPVLTTVAAFRSPTGECLFELGLKELCRQIAEALKARPARPGQGNLSHRFFTRGAADDQRIHDFLAAPRLERLRLSMNRYRLSCNPEWIFIYRPGVKIKAKGFSRFLEETTKIAQALMTCASDVQKSASGAASSMLSVSRGAGA